MAEIIIMPKLGFNMSEGKLVEWYKQEGDAVAKGENLFSIETDKTNMDIEATADGVVRKLFIGEGDTLPVTLPIAIVGDADEDISALLADAQAQLGDHASADSAESGTSAPAPTASGGAAPSAVDTAASASGNSGFDYDIAVLGGGPGGYVAAIKAAQMGKKVVIVEKERLGGTCLNVGCVPTKALLKSAEVLHELSNMEAFGVEGVDVSKAELNLEKVQARKKTIIDQLVGGVGGLLKSNGAVLKNGEGVLVDKNTIEVNGEKITADNIIIATGSVAKKLPITISDKMEVMTSTEILDIDKKPESIAIIGGGVIGMEFAYFLHCLGTKVTVIEFLDRIMPMVDEEITQSVTDRLISEGMEIHTSAKVTEITADGVLFEKDGKTEEVKVEKVLMAVGRAPGLTGVDAEALGIKTNKGAIVTDNQLRTSVPNIYAIGDVNGKIMLAHTASAEGLVAVETICGKKASMDYDKIPSAIYIQPEIASVGLTEADAKAKYGTVKVGRFPMLANGKAKVEGDERGLIKVITEAKYGEIVGVHMYCVRATDMIAETTLAMKLEATAEEVAATVHPHPTVSEVIQEAMHAIGGRAIHC